MYIIRVIGEFDENQVFLLKFVFILFSSCGEDSDDNGEAITQEDINDHILVLCEAYVNCEPYLTLEECIEENEGYFFGMTTDECFTTVHDYLQCMIVDSECLDGDFTDEGACFELEELAEECID